MIKVIDLKKSFKNNIVLDDINLEFKEGKIYGLIGRNGSGKSVFLKLLCGFLNPDSGSIYYDNINIVGSANFPPDTRALIEKPNFIPDITGFENLKLLSEIQNKINDKDIIKIIELLDLERFKDKKYFTYSLGTKQKFGIAQVLMENPKVIILDEPFNGVENKTVDIIRKKLLELKKQKKIIIIATHIKEDLDSLVDEIYEFDDGKIIKN